MKNPFNNRNNLYSENSLWSNLRHCTRQAGIKTTYTAMLLYFAYQRKETPAWARNIILGAIGYFLAPIDSIPDLTPILGFTDDLGVLSFGLVTIASYVNMDVKIEARKKLQDWFGEINLEDLEGIDKQL